MARYRLKSKKTGKTVEFEYLEKGKPTPEFLRSVLRDADAAARKSPLQEEARLDKPKIPSTNIFEKSWLFEPPEDKYRRDSLMFDIEPTFDKPGLDDSVWGSRLKGFGAGALDSISDLIADPLNFAGGVASLTRPRVKLPEVLPLDTPPPTIRGALPPARPRTTFISGDEGVIAADNPLAEQLASGVAGSTKTHSFGDLVDLDDMRARNAVYGPAQQYPGSRLELPDLPEPIIPGSTKRGFNRVSDADLGYPLNIAPEAVRPRQAQTVLDAIIPEEKLLELKSKIVDLSDSPIPKFESPSRAPYELPSAKPITRADKISKIKELADNPSMPPEIQGAAKEAGSMAVSRNPAKAITANKRDLVPEMGPNAYAGPERRINNGPLPDGITERRYNELLRNKFGGLLADESGELVLPSVPKSASTFVKSWTQSIDTELKNMGPAGKKIHDLLARYDQEGRQIAAHRARPLAQLKLSKAEQENIFDVIEKGAQPISPLVQQAVDIWKPIAKELGDEAVKSGLQMVLKSGKKGPFVPVGETYVPRRLTRQALENQKDFITKLVEEGYTQFEADQIYRNAKKFGEIFLPAQHARVGKRFPYRKDIGSLIEHTEGMSKRILQRQMFGPGKKVLSDLIKETPNPKRTRNLVIEALGERIKSPHEEILQPINNAVRTAQAIFHLQTFALKNIVGGQVPIIMKANTRLWLRSLRDVMLKSKEMGELEDISGATWNLAKSVSEGMMDDLGEISMTAYGGKWSENFNRGIAAWTGRAKARQLFDELKVNPDNLRQRAELQDYILDDIDKVLTQPSLTPKQETMAAGRFAEITQGLNLPRRIPYMWSNEWAQIPLIFKKYAFQGTRPIWDAIKAKPLENIPKLAILGQVSGEAIGAIKAGTIGGVKGAIEGEPLEGIKESYANRHDYVGRYTGSDNDVLNRVIANYLQGWTFGLMADIAEGVAGGDYSFTRMLAGPAIDQFSKVIGNLGRGNFEALGREGLRALPIPYVGGTGIQQAILPSPYQERQEGGSGIRLPQYQRPRRVSR